MDLDHPPDFEVLTQLLMYCTYIQKILCHACIEIDRNLNLIIANPTWWLIQLISYKLKILIEIAEQYRQNSTCRFVHCLSCNAGSHMHDWQVIVVRIILKPSLKRLSCNKAKKLIIKHLYWIVTQEVWRIIVAHCFLILYSSLSCHSINCKTSVCVYLGLHWCIINTHDVSSHSCQ